MSRRRGGRKAKVAIRSAPLSEKSKPVHPGESGGQYKPLNDEGVADIVENSFRILEEIGFNEATPHCIEACTAYGAVMSDDGRLRIPREVVKKANDLHVTGSRVYFATAGAAVMIADAETKTYRDAMAQDLYDMARIADTCEHIHIFQRTCVLNDIKDNYAMDLNTAYNCVMGTTKHVGSSWTEAHHLEKTLKLLHLMAGGEEAWRMRPFVSQSNCFVVPPMKFAEESLKCLRIAVEGGMPVLLLSAGQSGATAPPCLAGTVSQAWAECLGGLVYVNAIKPGAPAILGAWPFVSDLRTGAMSGGSPEQGLLSAACAQIGQHFGLPMGTGAGMSDAKLPDFQGGAEHASNVAVSALSGANIIYESAGMYSSLLGACLESLLLDNDLLGACMRMVKGIAVNEETLGFDEIKDVCLNNKSHYLGSDQTISVMQTEYIYPDFYNRLSPNQWKDAGKPEALDVAIQKKNHILLSHFPKHISNEVDDKIRAEFPIFLSKESMGRNG
jgi:trimethylamine--corrinoid protein Co-methyltransferase